MALFNACWLVLAWWLLCFGGLPIAGRWLGRTWQTGEPVRCIALAIGLSIYYVRILFTQFLFLKRGIAWSEALAIIPWVLIVFLLLATGGGLNHARPGATAALGIILFLAGSWMNSFAEYQRHAWKSRPENKGRLYTQGLFRWCRHPNYLGDLLSFSGLCLIAGAWFTVIVPLLMLGGFVFANIPMLDAHLHQHYGAVYDHYAEHTAKLFPFVY